MKSIPKESCLHCGAMLVRTSQAPHAQESWSCSECQHLYDDDERVRNASSPGVRVKRTPTSIILSWSWFRPDQVITLLFVLAFLAIATAFIFFSNPQGWTRFVALPFVVLALWEGWSLARGFLNRTTLTATKDQLRVAFGPLALSSQGRTLAADDLEQVFCVINPQRRFANVEVRTLEDARVNILLTHLKDAPRALFVERELERFYAIEDRAVRGELKKPSSSTQHLTVAASPS